MTAAVNSQSRRAAAFTLIEVILAIVIALGVLVVALYFYQQATNLRGQVIQETERIAAARLLMDRLTSELRGALPDWSLAPAFLGGSNNIQFIRADLPSFSAWTGGTLGRSAAPVTDLKRISYRLESSDGTNTGGVIRSEEPLLIRRQLSAMDDLGSSNSTAAAGAAPVLEEIQYLQFRYWSGTNWQDTWSGSGSPAGVEVSLGAEPATNGMDMAEYPAEIFRRVIYLAANTPAGLPGSKAQGVPAPEQDAPP
jgi:type II secretory pathway pseudopilin PulG